MKKTILLLCVLVATISYSSAYNWKAKWISSPYCQSEANSWIGFRKKVTIETLPEVVKAAIAADSKYWLWINDQLVVFEGGLKRGPTATDTYYDEVDIRKYLKTGVNTFNIVLWYFGKQGFSHNSSGKAGLLFDCQTSDFEILSDESWKSVILNAFSTCEAPLPNFRLSESSILYDASTQKNGFAITGFTDNRFHSAKIAGFANEAPWNQLHHRTIPLFRFSEPAGFKNCSVSTLHPTLDTLFCELPYNAQFTPCFKINAPKDGERIQLLTDNYIEYNGGATLLRAEYITRKGIQEYENPAWFNGHKAIFVYPRGIEFLEVNYRESGYDADITGTFECSDPFFNLLWKKATRTLYINMRDQFTDCPDRERAQWTGDAVTESAQAFYCLSPSAQLMSKKWLNEFFGWQKSNSVLFSPSPSGNWNAELPDQSLTTIGEYGLWNYYYYTADTTLLRQHLQPALNYLALWKYGPDGTIDIKKGDWNWGDWGENKDMKLLYNFWYYLAIKGLAASASELGRTDVALRLQTEMEQLKEVFNKLYWNGTAYRDPLYRGKTDDRAQALAVVSGIAGHDKYPALIKIFRQEEHASPYMEKYVFEAMVKMGHTSEALQRHKKRFAPMVNHPQFSTLFEGWGIGNEGFGGGTVNHSWSGGGLTVLAKEIAGIRPDGPGFENIIISPDPGYLTFINCTVAHKSGAISCEMKFTKRGVKATIQLPEGVTGNFVWKGKTIQLKSGKQFISL